MRFLLIGLLIVVLFVGSFFVAFMVLEHFDPLQHGQSPDNAVKNTPLPAPSTDPVSPPVESSPVSPGTAPVVEPAQPPEIPLSLNVLLSQQQYRIGESLTMTVSATQTCYLLLYDIDVQGAVARIFPNSQDSISRIQANVLYQIPGEGQFDLEIGAPIGNGQVYGICSVARIEPLLGFYPTRDNFDTALREHLYTLPDSEWTDRKVEYQIVAN
jgi:hypothetical protein